MAERISVEIGLDGGEDVRKTLEEIVGGVDGLKAAAEELGQLDATVNVKAEGADEAKTSVDDLKTAAEELGQTDATLNVKVEGDDEAKASIDGLKTAAEELGQTDATLNVKAEGAAEAKGLLDPLSQTATIIGASFDGMSLKMARVGKATEQIAGPLAQARVAFGGLSTAVDSLGTAAERLGARMTRSLGPLGVFARALGPLGIAAGIAAGALLKFGDSSADALNKLTVESAKLGLTAQQLDTLQQAFGKLSVAPDALASSLEKLKPLLGGGLLRVGDIVPPSVFAGIQQFIAKLEQMPDGVARTKLAIDTLGEALGGQVIAGLQTGAISAQNFAAALGSVTPATQEQIVQAAKYQQAINSLHTAWTELKAVIAPIATPIFEFLTQEIKNLKKDLGELIRQFQFAKAVFQVFKAGIAGEDMGAAAKRAAEEYTKATQTAQQTEQAIAKVGQTAQIAVPVFTRFGTVAEQAGPAIAQGFNQIDAPLEEAKRKIAELQAQLSKPATLSGIAPSIDFSAIITAAQSAATQITTLFQTAFSNLGTSVGTVDFSAILTAAQTAVTQISTLFHTAFSNLGASIDASGISAAFQNAWATITTGATTAATAITTAFSAISFAGLISQIDGVVAVFRRMEEAADAAAAAVKRAGGSGGGGGGGAPRLAGGGLLGGRGTGTSDSNFAWVSRGEYIMPAGVVRQPGVASFLEALRRSGRIPGFAQGGAVGGASVGFGQAASINQIAQAINSLAQSITDAFNLVARQDTLTEGINAILRAIGGVAQKSDATTGAVDALTAAFGDLTVELANRMQISGEERRKIRGGMPMARGGLLGGRGTGTSDSNLAWVSRGEHIMPARAVRQPGVLAFLELLRRSGGDLRRVLDGMGRFALGGMVPRAIPAFAGGGLAGGMSNVTIQFPGLPAIGGLRASSDVVDQLQKAAALAQVRSGGRKPSRYS